MIHICLKKFLCRMDEVFLEVDLAIGDKG
jgi:hypothetical protein